MSLEIIYFFAQFSFSKLDAVWWTPGAPSSILSHVFGTSSLTAQRNESTKQAKKQEVKHNLKKKQNLRNFRNRSCCIIFLLEPSWNSFDVTVRSPVPSEACGPSLIAAFLNGALQPAVVDL